MFQFLSQELLQRSEKYRRFWEGAGLSVGSSILHGFFSDFADSNAEVPAEA